VDLAWTHDRLDVLMIGQVRVDAGLANPQFVATGVVGTLQAGRHWNASAGYLFADLPQANAVAHVPLVAVTPNLAIRRWSFADGNRAERLLDYAGEPYRYRNRVTADFALGKERRARLYVANEVIFEVAPRRAWNQNRAQAGVGMDLGERMRLDAYFLERSAPQGRETAVLGTVLKVAVRRGMGW
jgi:hypothetical protein